MGSLRISVHPLFFIFGLYYALRGDILIFIVYTFSALAHEIGHSLCADKYGYRLNKIKLMPFGAIAKGNIDGLKLKDEIRIALAGPLVNAFIALFFIALWWIEPITYAFTDTAVLANLSLFLVNLAPAKPLDGGRILFASLALKFGDKKAEIVCKILSLVLSGIFFALFIISLVARVFNFSALFFGAFLLIGTLEKNKESKYIRIYSTLKEDRLLRGAPVKIQAVSKDISIKRLLSILDDRAVNEIEVYDKDIKIAYLTQSKINEIIEKGDLYKTVKEYV